MGKKMSVFALGGGSLQTIAARQIALVASSQRLSCRGGEDAASQGRGKLLCDLVPTGLTWKGLEGVWPPPHPISPGIAGLELNPSARLVGAGNLSTLAAHHGGCMHVHS